MMNVIHTCVLLYTISDYGHVSSGLFENYTDQYHGKPSSVLNESETSDSVSGLKSLTQTSSSWSAGEKSTSSRLNKTLSTISAQLVFDVDESILRATGRTSKITKNTTTLGDNIAKSKSSTAPTPFIRPGEPNTELVFIAFTFEVRFSTVSSGPDRKRHLQAQLGITIFSQLRGDFSIKMRDRLKKAEVNVNTTVHRFKSQGMSLENFLIVASNIFQSSKEELLLYIPGLDYDNSLRNFLYIKDVIKQDPCSFVYGTKACPPTESYTCIDGLHGTCIELNQVSNEPLEHERVTLNCNLTLATNSAASQAMSNESSFPVTIIIIVVVLCIVLGIVIFIVCCLRKKCSDSNDGPAVHCPRTIHCFNCCNGEVKTRHTRESDTCSDVAIPRGRHEFEKHYHVNNYQQNNFYQTEKEMIEMARPLPALKNH